MGHGKVYNYVGEGTITLSKEITKNIWKVPLGSATVWLTRVPKHFLFKNTFESGRSVTSPSPPPPQSQGLIEILCRNNPNTILCYKRAANYNVYKNFLSAKKFLLYCAWLTIYGINLLFEQIYNGNIITWISHQILRFSNHVNHAAGFNINSPLTNPLAHPFPSYWMNELTNKWGPCYQAKVRTIFPLS